MSLYVGLYEPCDLELSQIKELIFPSTGSIWLSAGTHTDLVIEIMLLINVKVIFVV